MATPKLSREVAQQAVDEYTKADGIQTVAAKALGIPVATMQSRLRSANTMGIKPSPGVVDKRNPSYMAQQIKRLEAELKTKNDKDSDLDVIKGIVWGMKQSAADYVPPEWSVTPPKKESSPGVPTLFLSDLHWAETVYPSQVNGVNKYNLAIARERLHTAVESGIELLRIIDPKMRYPGVVCPLGGDMFSGNIHDELTATNEINSMPAVLDLYGHLVNVVNRLVQVFGRVMLPCVTGNHGRNTQKIWNKDRHHTSFDWLLYQFLAKHFESDKRVTFFIPDGPDAYYRIYGHKYLLTHGDQFRGGDSMIGCLGPIIRGDHKKRSRNGQIDMDYDVMIMGHWHQYIHHNRVIVNGSLKGYDEYAYNNSFGFESPQQALWVTHPKYGITFRMPVYVDRQRNVPKTAWTSIAETKGAS